MFNGQNTVAYNRFAYVDGISDRIFYYLLTPNNKTAYQLEQTFQLWKLLYYNDYDALNHELPKYKDLINLVSKGIMEIQNDKRLFRSPHFEDAWTEQCSIIKVYIDSVIPNNTIYATVNVGIDVICHNKIIDIRVPDDELCLQPPIDIVDGVEYRIETKSRVESMFKAVVGILNGADVAGVGKLEFTQQKNRFIQAQYGIWNNRNFEGMKIVMGVGMSNISEDCGVIENGMDYILNKQNQNINQNMNQNMNSTQTKTQVETNISGNSNPNNPSVIKNPFFKG